MLCVADKNPHFPSLTVLAAIFLDVGTKKVWKILLLKHHQLKETFMESKYEKFSFNETPKV